MKSAGWMALSLATALALILGVTEAGARSAGPPSGSEPLYWYVDPDGDGGIEIGDEVFNSSAEIWRDEGGISFRIRTTGLEKGHGHTVWLFSYDNPEKCLWGDGSSVTGDDTPGKRCTGYDLLNPAALGSIMWGGAGKFVEGDGLTIFTGRRPANTGNRAPCVTEPVVVYENCSGVLLGHGLHNPLGAEIHFVLRDHGPDQEGVSDETTTINGGCDPATHHGLPVFGPGWGRPGNYACYDPQGNN